MQCEIPGHGIQPRFTVDRIKHARAELRHMCTVVHLVKHAGLQRCGIEHIHTQRVAIHAEDILGQSGIADHHAR